VYLVYSHRHAEHAVAAVPMRGGGAVTALWRF
jgi:hypothetical protein